MNEETVQRGHLGRAGELAWISIVLTAINIIVFFVQSATGSKMYELGALNFERVVLHKEYYRILTCMFLHAGIEHLFSNMLMLYYLGEMLEKAIGPRKFLFLYCISGIGSGAASMFQEILTGQMIFSVGASGAIYGISGAMLFLVIVKKGRYGTITLRRMILAIFFMLYSGMRDIHVNNAAHIGGLCIGFLTIYVMYVVDTKLKGR